MHKKQMIFLSVLTAMVIAILTTYIGYTIRSVNNTVEKYCYEELDNTCDSLADELHDVTEMDRTILSAMASVIGERDELNKDELCSIMNTYNTSLSYINYIEVLFPDNTILSSDGTVRDVSGLMDFQEEKEKGMYISEMTKSTLDPDENVLRNVVPVEKDGEVRCILFGTVRLSDFAKNYKTDIYEGNAYVYLLDGNTGQFMLDTWHNSYGNVRDVSKRTMLPGYDFNKAIEDMQKGLSGDLGFYSRTTGDVLYMHYAPIGINNWSVVITVERTVAMRESSTISRSLYWMAGVVGFVILSYMACVLFLILRAYRQVRKVATEDQTTGLFNRNAYERYISSNRKTLFSGISCIFIDANGLHEINNKYGHAVGDQMLCLIADALRKEFSPKNIYRVGGDEFVVLSESDLTDCQDKMKRVESELEKQQYNISVGIIYRKEEIGVERIIHEADEKMLTNKREFYQKNDRRRDKERN